MIPGWLHGLSIAALGLGGVSALVIVADLLRHRQHMWIMNLVWPITALFGGAWIVWQYFRYGRQSGSGRTAAFPILVVNATLHCGSGCTLGDICAEWLAFGFPGIAVAFGWHSLFSQRMFAMWIVDYLFAYGFGILFQYFTIAPMRHLSVAQGIRQAIKADTFSLTAWQVGMYGFMAVAGLVIFGRWLRAPLEADIVEFWFMMQIAMLFGFATSYPVNWWLLRSGVKEPM